MKNGKPSISAETGPWRLWLWAACEGFVLFSLLRCMRLESVGDALVCLLVGAGATVPWVLERLGYRMSGPLFVFTLFYLLASMSGRGPLGQDAAPVRRRGLRLGGLLHPGAAGQKV